MAAGEGTRLRPLTERWPKPILPIDGRPVIATLLRELGAAGCEVVSVVTGYRAEEIEELDGDGSAFALDVRYVRQPGVLGSADTVRRALDAGASPPLLVSAADTVYPGGDLRRFADAFQRSGAAGAIAVRRDPAPDGSQRQPVRIEGSRVVRLIDDNPGNPLSAAPLWAFGPELVPLLDGLPGPPFELSQLYERAVSSALEIGGLEIGKMRDLTHPEDLIRENFPYLGS